MSAMISRRKFLFTASGLATAMILPESSHFREKTGAVFKAGTGLAWLKFPTSSWPLEGYTGQHDPLAVRVLLMDDGRIRTGTAVVDTTSISQDMVTIMKGILFEVAQVHPHNSLIYASHTFSAPHILPSEHLPKDLSKSNLSIIIRSFEAAMREAATRAANTLQPATIGFNSGISRINVNRDMPGKQGWWLQANDSGYSDSQLNVIRINNIKGEALAILINYGVQSSITEDVKLSNGNKLVSSDLAGAVSRNVEDHFDGKIVAFFLIGAAGDQSPIFQGNRCIIKEDGTQQRIDIHEQAYTLLALLSDRLSGDVVRICDAIDGYSMPEIHIYRYSVKVPALNFTPENAAKVPLSYFSYKPAGEADVPVMVMRIGKIAWVGLQPELAASIGEYIHRHSPFALTLITTMLDGAAKYMPDAISYDRFTYEARSSPFAKGAAEQLSVVIISKLKKVKFIGSD
ncbi:hypothetical protein ABEG90_23070 [Pantoea agglomerans]|uniref:hypothetical protein n=1 Tax=Enterobacter agglomerans TaxID=549 RepID=UPI003209D9A5